MCKCLSSLIRHLYHSLSNLKKHPRRVLSMPIFLLNFHSFPKQKTPLGVGKGGEYRFSTPSQGKHSQPVLSEGPLSQAETRGGKSSLLNVCILNAKNLSHMLQAASDHGSLSQWFLNGTACLFLLLYKHKKRE